MFVSRKKYMKIAMPIAFVLAAVCSAGAYAQSEVYLCVDEHGNREYKNTGLTKGCKRVELPGITTIEGTRPRAAAQTSTARTAASEGFPKVDSSTQKARDNDRRQILQDELKIEEEKRAALQKEFNNGEPERQGGERNYAKYQARVTAMKEELERHDKNIDALKREIGNLK